MQTSQLSKMRTSLPLRFYCVSAVFCCWSQLSSAIDYKVAAEYHTMDASWSALPSMPASFQSASGVDFDISIEFDEFGFEVKRSSLDLGLARAVEPKDVSLSSNSDAFGLSFMLSDHQKVTLSFGHQEADVQRFPCYDFNGITIGSCRDADFQVANNDAKYDYLEGDLVGISANAKSFGVNFSQTSSFKWIDTFSVSLVSTVHDYDWSTPVEDLESPFILALMFEDRNLGDSIDEAFRRFPQRNRWRMNQFNLGVAKAIPVYGNLKVFAEGEFAYFEYSKYRPVRSEPNYNVKIRSGLRLDYQSFLIELFGNYYHKNLIGFEPITFNQRTEHYFNQSYGNLGIRVAMKF